MCNPIGYYIIGGEGMVGIIIIGAYALSVIKSIVARRDADDAR